MKSESTVARINNVLFEIHQDIAADHTIASLSRRAAYSEFHFQRVFLAVVGEAVHQYVRRVRLEHAANQLMFDPKMPIQDVAVKCGFQSLSSFSRAFKQHFELSPGRWRKRDPINQSHNYLSEPEIFEGFNRVKYKEIPEPELVDIAPTSVVYIRHLGYDKSIGKAWQKLFYWARQNGLESSRQIGLHHSNPTWVPLSQCRYVACLAMDAPIANKGYINSMVIPGGLHARFPLQGVYGELLPFISRILEEWLPASGFKLKTTPAWAEYKENQFISKNRKFDLHFNLPIGLF